MLQATAKKLRFGRSTFARQQLSTAHVGASGDQNVRVIRGKVKRKDQFYGPANLDSFIILLANCHLFRCSENFILPKRDKLWADIFRRVRSLFPKGLPRVAAVCVYVSMEAGCVGRWVGFS